MRIPICLVNFRIKSLSQFTVLAFLLSCTGHLLSYPRKPFKFWPTSDNFLDTAWNNCTNLRQLHLYYLDFEHVEAIMASPKHECGFQHAEVIIPSPTENLKVLEVLIHQTREISDVKKVIDMCAFGTKSVENFIFKGPRVHHDTLKTFFDKNETSLRSNTLMSTLKWRYNPIDDEFAEASNKLFAIEEICSDYRFSEKSITTHRNFAIPTR